MEKKIKLNNISFMSASSLIKKTMLILIFINLGALANDKTDIQCIPALKNYENKYKNIDKVNDVQRLKYLNSIQDVCRDNSMQAIFKSDILERMKKIDEAFLILDKAIANYSQPIGIVLYKKAALMQRMISSGYKDFSSHTDLTYEETILLYEQVLRTNTNVKPLVHLGLAEVYVLTGKLDKAIEYINSGVKLDRKLLRFHTLAAIIESKNKNYKNTLKYMEFVINNSGENYMKEPDAVLALVTALCHSERNDLGVNIVNKAVSIAPNSSDIPDIIAAYKVVKGCKIEKSNKENYLQ